MPAPSERPFRHFREAPGAAWSYRRARRHRGVSARASTLMARMPALISTTSAHVPRYPPRVPPAPIHRSRPTKNRTTSRPRTSHTNPASPLDGMSPGRILPAHVVEPKWPSPGGRTLVFLHGWPDSPRLWDAQIAHLSEAGHRCVAVPLPGYPPDDAPNRTQGAPRPNFDTAVDDVIATVAALTTARERPFVFVCHDWGCLVGYKLQRRSDPNFVAALAPWTSPRTSRDLPRRNSRSSSPIRRG